MLKHGQLYPTLPLCFQSSALDAVSADTGSKPSPPNEPPSTRVFTKLCLWGPGGKMQVAGMVRKWNYLLGKGGHHGSEWLHLSHGQITSSKGDKASAVHWTM
mmetsp:Transcript_74002/g.130583  ORF Transcript_74002/g.130583 Transcript_74002/m.130583 type:complete len:102 (+) Transcript_74002:1380-1685(+)